MTTTSLNKAWILTFTDLVSLLLTFFVMMFAMATPPKLTNEPNISVVRGLTAPSSAVLSQRFLERSVNLDYLYHVLSSNSKQIDKTRLHLSPDKLVISLPAGLSFDNAELSLSGEEKAQILSLGFLLNNLSNKIAVQTSADLSDMEKAVGYSAQVANLLKQGGYKDAVPVYAHPTSKVTGQIDIIIYPYAKEK